MPFKTPLEILALLCPEQVKEAFNSFIFTQENPLEFEFTFQAFATFYRKQNELCNIENDETLKKWFGRAMEELTSFGWAVSYSPASETYSVYADSK